MVRRHLLPSLDDQLMQINHQVKGRGGGLLVWNLNICTSAIYSLIDVIAQGVLVRRKPQKKTPDFSFHSSQIYRCWEVWGRKLAVVVVPFILALISLGESS